MNKKFGIYTLILCFILSSTNAGLAAQIVNVPPVVVQPYGIQQLNDQALDIDRKNRDKEVEIRDLIDQNNRLIQEILAKGKNPGLASMDQTMLAYRDALNERDRERILANSQRPGGARYGDLVALTEDADDMTVHQELVDKSGMLTQKFQLLSSLENEMTQLNEKLGNQQSSTSTQQESVIDGFKKLAQEQQDKIQMLVTRLSEMDQKISQLDDLLIQKEEQIAQLKEKLSVAQSESSAKDETIREQNDKISVLENQSKVPAAPVTTAIAPIVVNPTGNQQDDARLQTELSEKDQVIKTQQDQITLLRDQLKNVSPSQANVTALPPITVNPPSNTSTAPRLAALLVEKDELIRSQEDQITALKSQLKNILTAPVKVTALPPINVNPPSNPRLAAAIAAKDKRINEQQEQIDSLKAQARQLLDKENFIQTQADQIKAAAAHYKGQDALFVSIQTKIADLRNKVQIQVADLKSKNDTIHWLNQVLAAAKNKAKYYQLASEMAQGRLTEIQQQVKVIQSDFALHAKDYDQFENSILSLKERMARMSYQMAQKDDEINRLKSQLSYQTTQQKEHMQKQSQAEDLLGLAKELIELQEEEAYLLGQKDDLEQDQNKLFDQHASAFEAKIKQLLAQHKIQDINLLSRLQALQSQLSQREGEVSVLHGQLTEKIDQERNQTLLVEQVQDLSNKIQTQDNQVSDMETKIKENGNANLEVDSLKQQLATAQDSLQQLKAQLDNKLSESNQMTAMMGDYQQKLEAKNDAYNKQFGEILSFKKYHALMEKQIANLDARLQAKEAQVITIKQAMYDLQKSAEAKNMDLQAKDLSLAMIQQRETDDKIKQYEDKINGLQAQSDEQTQTITSLKAHLNAAQAKLKNAPSADEMTFLRTGLKKATDELNQKDDALAQIKADMDQYTGQSKQEELVAARLKTQLQQLQQKMEDRGEDLKYANMAIVRLKERSKASTDSLTTQVADLTRQLGIAQQGVMSPTQGNKVRQLQMQLRRAQMQIKGLEQQVKELNSVSGSDMEAIKLRQALNKIDQQGRIINFLAQKLQDCGQKVDLTHVQ